MSLPTIRTGAVLLASQRLTSTASAGPVTITGMPYAEHDVDLYSDGDGTITHQRRFAAPATSLSAHFTRLKVTN